MSKKQTNQKYERNPEIRIYGVAKIIHEQLNNIAENTGVNLSDFLKPHLREIVDKYPDKMKQPPLKY